MGILPLRENTVAVWVTCYGDNLLYNILYYITFIYCFCLGVMSSIKALFVFVCVNVDANKGMKCVQEGEKCETRKGQSLLKSGSVINHCPLNEIEQLKLWSEGNWHIVTINYILYVLRFQHVFGYTNLSFWLLESITFTTELKMLIVYYCFNTIFINTINWRVETRNFITFNR